MRGATRMRESCRTKRGVAMQMNLLRKVSLLEFRAASSSDAVKPTPSVRIGFGRAGAAGHRRTTRFESSVRNLGGLAIAKAK